MTKEEVLQEIKLRVKEILPHADVLLFGSRANNTEHEESDWDILVLTDELVNYQIKDNVRNKVFEVSLKICAFMNTIIVNRYAWENHSRYYSLNKSVSQSSFSIE